MAERLSPNELQWFAAQRARARQAYELGAAQNKYEKAGANTRYGWTTEDLKRNFTQQRARFATPFLQRGMMNSGNYGQRLTEFRNAHSRDLFRANEGNRWQNQGYDLASSQLAKVRDDALAELRDQEKAYRDTLATQIANYS